MKLKKKKIKLPHKKKLKKKNTLQLLSNHYLLYYIYASIFILLFLILLLSINDAIVKNYIVPAYSLRKRNQKKTVVVDN